MTKISTSDWRNLEIEKWNTTTFRKYLADQHEAKFGIPYVTNNYAMEGRHIKVMIAEYGAEVVKAFIDVCMAEYKPTRQYPGLNFAFMYSYMRARNLPRVLAEAKRLDQATAEIAVQDEVENSEWW